ncbi:50S ribosomal protein L25/general stress protein Ctc [Fictibacillus sp. Mic-4]|uniref:50S ribosomal protein L25/general stress protein Ctc n=1 Tax=Fictibacillus sp. Mic-4 TaxID=3132826 RepID=UPI003CE7E8CA
MATTLNAINRNHFKRSYKHRLREEGNVPSVLYGNGTDPRNLAVQEVEFIKVLREVGKNGIISLKTEDNETFNVMVQDMQKDSLKDSLTHIDFLVVDLKKKIEADVPVHVTGESPGVKEGGVLQRVLHTVKVKALPNELPEQIDVHIDQLMIGDSLVVNDLPQSASYEILNDENEVVLTVLPPTVPETNEAEQDGDDKAGEAIDAEDKEPSA